MAFRRTSPESIRGKKADLLQLCLTIKAWFPFPKQRQHLGPDFSFSQHWYLGFDSIDHIGWEHCPPALFGMTRVYSKTIFCQNFPVLFSVAFVWHKLYFSIPRFCLLFSQKRVVQPFFNQIVKSREATFQEFVFTKGTILKLTTGENALQTTPFWRYCFQTQFSIQRREYWQSCNWGSK